MTPYCGYRALEQGEPGRDMSGEAAQSLQPASRSRTKSKVWLKGLEFPKIK